MKITNEISYMVRKVSSIDLWTIITMILFIVVTNNKHVIFLLLGFLLGNINFYVNTYTTCYVFSKMCTNAKLLVILSYFFRIIFISVIGLIVCIYDSVCVLPYIFGYTMHYISILIYGVKNNLNGK